MLEEVERNGPAPEEAAAAVAFVVLQQLALDPAALAGPLRRSLLLLAAGGDPHRALEPGGRAVAALAEELDDLVAPQGLMRALARAREEIRGLTLLEAAAERLGAPPEARTALALALLADELG